MATRVFRPARILPEPMQVSLPRLQERLAAAQPLDGGGSAEGAGPDVTGERGAPIVDEIARTPREQQLESENAQLSQTLREREEAHNTELQETHSRVVEGLRRVEEIVASLTSAIDAFEAQRNQALQEIEAGVVPLALAIARRVVGEALAVREEIVLDTVRRALSLVKEKERVVIRVHPADYALVSQHAEEWLHALERSRSMDFEKDTRVSRGGCQIETESGSIEAQIDKQLAALEEALVEGGK